MNEQTTRPWGFYEVLSTIQGAKTKLLVVNPNCSLSMQKHFFRSEIWVVESGTGHVETDQGIIDLNRGDVVKIGIQEWHRLFNTSMEPLRIIEVQLGELCEETDIERK